MKYLHSAFIENTPDMREWLESIGYEKHIYFSNNTKYIYTEPELCKYFSIVSKLKKFLSDRCIDCTGNPQLFKAITAMREDSDKEQWFTDGKEFILCDREDWIDMISCLCSGGHYNYDRNGELSKDFYKATLEELIEHFKK